ncbi:Uncharacterized protein FWK35_00013309, partial [Aphis craccivora]
MLDSERSDECIGFKMMCEGGFRWKSKYSWCIIEVKCKKFPLVFKKSGKTTKKGRKTGIFTQNHYNSEMNHFKYLNFSPSIYINVIYTFNFFAFFKLMFIKLL